MGYRVSSSTAAGWEKRRLVRSLWAVIAISGFCIAQTQPAQPDSSLADAARQARAQKAQNGSDASDAQSKAQQTANELSEDQNDKNPSRATQNTAQAPASATDNAATAHTAANPPGSTVPAGFKVQGFKYCKSRSECWNASVLVPAEAQLVSSTCKQYAFEAKVQATTFLLMAGPATADCDGNGGTDLVRWKQLVDPENKRAPGTYSLISSLNTTLGGKPAVVTTMSFRKGLDSWMGKRAELENNGVPLVVGCMAPRDHFADGDAVCTKLLESLVLP
jgi:hypothetical protein